MVVIANHIEGYFNDCRGKLVSVFRGFFPLQLDWQKTPTNPKEEACFCPIKLHNWIYACIGSKLAVLFLYQSGQRYVDLSNQVTQLHLCRIGYKLAVLWTKMHVFVQSSYTTTSMRALAPSWRFYFRTN